MPGNFMIAAEAMASRWMIMDLAQTALGLGIERRAYDSSAHEVLEKIDSLPTDQFWSRAPIKFGSYAVKFTLRPLGSITRGIGLAQARTTSVKISSAAAEGAYHV